MNSKIMRFASETKLLEKLGQLRERLRSKVSEGYEFRAKSCAHCEVQGACCTDRHFVNVRITRLESKAISLSIGNLNADARNALLERIEGHARELSGDDGRFACPLYEKGTGCLVHSEAKPMPCIFHACYDSSEHLPPEELLDEAEADLAALNLGAYGTLELLPIPLALCRAMGLNSNAGAAHREPSSEKASRQK